MTILIMIDIEEHDRKLTGSTTIPPLVTAVLPQAEITQVVFH